MTTHPTAPWWRRAAGALWLLLAASHALAAPAPPPGPARPGTVSLRVDATDTRQWVFQVRQQVPVTPGPLRLQYPLWLPGFHGPHGDTRQIAGLVVSAGGQRLAWQRTTSAPNSFDLVVPAGVQAVDIAFQWLGGTGAAFYQPPRAKDVLGLQWPSLLLYPAGHPARAIQVQASVKLPPGWGWGAALRARREFDGWVEFEPVDLDTLVDSPLFAGAGYRRVELDPPGTAQPAVLHLFSGREGTQAPSDAQIDAHRQLVRQADQLFGHRPWRHYDLLLANAKGVNESALEHQQSSENAYAGDYFDDWAKASRRRDDVAHEFVHAWNGKHRRPADLWTADFNTAGGNSLLWVYEGLTQYWGIVLAARSGLITPEQAQRHFGNTAAWYQHAPGRHWRNLQDTTIDPALVGGGRRTWPSWSRGFDYYDESAVLVWLDADTLIRERSRGQRSLDDFARDFFAAGAGGPGPELYTFDDVVAALNRVLPHDWRAFLRERLDRHSVDVPLDGLARAGWRLDHRDARSALELASQDPDKPVLWLGHSLGAGVGRDGEIREVVWDTPAFREGLARGDKIVAVNLRAYTPDRLEAALVANKGGQQPLDLLVRRDDDFRALRFDLREGPRHPLLVRVEGAPDRLADILKPR